MRRGGKKEEEELNEEAGRSDEGAADEEREEEVAGEAWIAESPEGELERVASELEAKTHEAAENYDRFLRATAELDNFRKRAAKEKLDTVAYANEKLILEVLPVIDNLERAVEHASSGAEGDSLAEGVALTISQMFAVLKKFGLEEIKAIGELFDPNLHHAISHDDGEGAEPGTVVKEFQKGYTLKGRVIRPSMVSVARDAESGSEEGQTEGA